MNPYSQGPKLASSQQNSEQRQGHSTTCMQRSEHDPLSLVRAGRQWPRRDTSPSEKGGAYVHFKQRSSDWPISHIATLAARNKHLRAANASARPPSSAGLLLLHVVLHVRYYIFVRTLVSESWVHDAACWAAGAKALADAASARMLEAMQVFMIDN